MRHPADGTLRRLLDDPAGCPTDERDHVAACDACARTLDEMRADARLVSAALSTGVDVDALDLDAAWRRLSAATAAPPAAAPVLTPIRRSRDRWRGLLRRPAVAGAAFAVVLVGAGTAAANDWFRIFETERVAPISISPAAILNALPDLDDYGDVSFSGEPDIRRVEDAAAAEAATGIDVPEVTDLPRGIVGEPAYRVGDEVAVTFTYDDAAAGGTAPELDGSSVRLVAGPGVAAVWPSEAGAPALLVGRAAAPTGDASGGVTFEAMRDHLLSLPDLPEEVAASLRSFNADRSTFPLPLPAGRVETEVTEVDGVEATLVTSRDGTLAAVTWVADGHVNVVAGPLDADEVLDVARELR